MSFQILGWVLLVLAGLPLQLVMVNLLFYRKLRPAKPEAPSRPAVSVLIPARNEEAEIAETVRSVLASRGVQFELLVMDDQSEDRTAERVEQVAARDHRLRLLRGSGPPEGWNGKQYACWRLAQEARHDLLMWIDADVRLNPDALARIADRMADGRCPLLSGFPQQVTRTWAEQLVVSLILFLLLGYLPMAMMKWTRMTMFATGCGQMFIAWRAPYFETGGHRVIQNSRHDGLKLPIAFRRSRYWTDLFDASDLASCRMYRNAGEVWAGFAKNATEGMATPLGLPTWTLLLIGGHVLPWLMLIGWAVGLVELTGPARWLIGGAAGAAAMVSVVVGLRCRQDWLAVAGRPVGLAMLVTIQWQAMWRRLTGRVIAWRGRAHTECGKLADKAG